MRITRPLVFVGIGFAFAIYLSTFLIFKTALILILAVFFLMIISAIFLRKSKRICALIILLSIISAISIYQLKEYYLYKPIIAYEKQDITAIADVVDISKNNKGTNCYTMKFVFINEKKIFGNAKINIYSKSPLDIEIFERVDFSTTALPISSTSTFDSKTFYKQKGVFLFSFEPKNIAVIPCKKPYVKLWFYNLNRKFSTVIEQYFPPTSGGLVDAIILGNRNNISTKTNADFAKAGILHIVAISGLHISLIALFLGKIFAHKKIGIIFSIAVVWGFVALTNFHISTVRSAIMQTILLVALLTGRQNDSINSLFGSAILILFANPFAIFDVGFLLSFLSVLGIILFYERVYFWLHFHFYPTDKSTEFLLQSISTTLAVYIPTIPIFAFYFSGVSLAGFLSNIVAIPLLPIIFFFGIMTITSGQMEFLHFFTKIFAQITQTATDIMIFIAKSFAQLDFLYIGTNNSYLKSTIFLSVLTVLFCAILGKLGKNKKLMRLSVMFCVAIFALQCISLPFLSKNNVSIEIISNYNSSAIIITSQKKSTVITVNEDNYLLDDVSDYLDGVNIKSVELYAQISPQSKSITAFSRFLQYKDIQVISSANCVLQQNFCDYFHPEIEFTSALLKQFNFNDYSVIISENNVYITVKNKTICITTNNSIAKNTNCEILLFYNQTDLPITDFSAKNLILLSDDNINTSLQNRSFFNANDNKISLIFSENGYIIEEK